jgi:hypothetical protein
VGSAVFVASAGLQPRESNTVATTSPHSSSFVTNDIVDGSSTRQLFSEGDRDRARTKQLADREGRASSASDSDDLSLAVDDRSGSEHGGESDFNDPDPYQDSGSGDGSGSIDGSGEDSGGGEGSGQDDGNDGGVDKGGGGGSDEGDGGAVAKAARTAVMVVPVTVVRVTVVRMTVVTMAPVATAAWTAMTARARVTARARARVTARARTATRRPDRPFQMDPSLLT